MKRITHRTTWQRAHGNIYLPCHYWRLGDVQLLLGKVWTAHKKEQARILATSTTTVSATTSQRQTSAVKLMASMRMMLSASLLIASQKIIDVSKKAIAKL